MTSRPDQNLADQNLLMLTHVGAYSVCFLFVTIDSSDHPLEKGKTVSHVQNIFLS